MLTASDIRGVCALPPTPCKPGAEGWDSADSINLDESERATEALIAAGIGSIALCGTTGECAALLWEEKRDYVASVADAINGRVPLFAGATALGTKEVVRQMRGLRDAGADGVLVGLPLWQTPTLENSVAFFADLGEAVPDLAIMVYANSMFFKSEFETDFWEGIGKRAPTVVTNKVAYDIAHLADDIAVAGHRVNFLPGEDTTYAAYKLAPSAITACWSTGAALGPEPYVALMDAILADDAQRVDEIYADLSSVPPVMPPGHPFREWFPRYNAQIAKWRVNAAGFMQVGLPRAPYRDLPDAFKAQAELNGAAYSALRAKYRRDNSVTTGADLRR